MNPHAAELIRRYVLLRALAPDDSGSPDELEALDYRAALMANRESINDP